MFLTKKQESIIARYVHEVAMQLDVEIPEHIRERALTRLEKQIKRELSAIQKDAIEDTDLRMVLGRFGDPRQRAAALAAQQPRTEGLALSLENRVWLGVCASLAAHLEVHVRAVRAAAFLLGLFTGPIAIVAYLVLYARIHRAAGDNAPRIDWLRLLLRAGGVLLTALALHAFGRIAMWGIRFAIDVYLKRPAPILGGWGWLELHGGELLFYALAITLPLAVLSAMPVAEGWNHTLKRVSEALHALYGLIISFGIACYLAGVILDITRDFFEILPNLPRLG